MFRRSWRKVLAPAILSGLTLISGVGLAQDAGPPEHQPTPPPAPGDALEGEVDVPMRAKAKISSNEMRTQSENYLDKMKDTLRRVVELQELARKKKDVIKLNCVNDKL